MLLNEDVGLLQSIPLFSKIEPQKLKLISFTAERVIYQPHDVLFHKGDTGANVLILLEGSADAVLPKGTKNHVVATVQKGEIIGEIAVLCGVPRTLTLIAREQVTALSLDKDLFIRLMREIPDLAIQMVHDLARRLANTIDQLDHKTEKGNTVVTALENTLRN